MSSKAKVRSFAALLVLAAAFLLAALLGWGIPMEKVRAETTHTVNSAGSLAWAMATAQEGDTVQLTATIEFDLTDADLVSSIWPESSEPNKDLVLDATNETLPAHSQTLDLNGNTLEVITGSQKSCFTLVGGVTLTITDSKGGGKIVGASNGNFFNGTAESGLVLEGVAIEFGDYADDIVADKPAISTAGSLSLNKVTYNAGTSGVGGPALVDTESLADGTYVYTEGSNYFVGGEEILSQAGAVAAVEGTATAYTTLQAAVDAIPENSEEPVTVTLLADITEGASPAAIVKPNRSLNWILDLNGHDITVAGANGAIYYGNNASGTITIRGEGTLANTQSGPNCAIIDVSWATGVTINLEGGTYRKTSSGNNEFIVNVTNANNLTALNISGGTFEEGKVRGLYGSELNISEGLFRDEVVVYGAGSIEGGTFENEITFGSSATLNISGGFFKVEPDEKYLADNFEFVDNDGDGIYEVMEGVVAKIGNVGYTGLGEAFAEAEDEDTIRLVSDEAVIDGETGRILIEKRVIFDLNGYTLTIGAGLGNTVALNVRANGDLTLTDSSEALTGKIDATEADKIVDHGTVPVGTMQAGAKLTVLSGTIIVDTDSESCVFGMAGTTISIEGGTFINLADTPYVHGGGTPLTVNIDKNASDASAILQVTGGTFIGRNPALGDDSVKTGNFIPDTVKLTLTYNEQGEAVYTVLDADAEVPEGTPAVYSVESGAVVATVYTAKGLEEALAEGYATVRLGDDIQGNFTISKALTLDLNGKNLSSESGRTLQILASGVVVTDNSATDAAGTISGQVAVHAATPQGAEKVDVTIKNVSILSTADDSEINAVQTVNAKLTLDHVNVTTYYYAVSVFTDSELTIRNSEITATATKNYGETAVYIDCSDAEITDTTINSASSGISIFGQYGDGKAAAAASASTYNTLSIQRSEIGAVVYAVANNGAHHGTVIEIADSNIAASVGTGIFHPGYGTLTVSGGSTVSGESGIEMRAGILTIKDETVSVQATAKAFDATPSGNGNTLTGVAVGISQHTTNLPVDVTLSEGTYSTAAADGYAFYEVDLQDNVTEGVAASIQNGTFNGAIAGETVSNFIENGTFSEPVESNYLVAERTLSKDDDGNYVVSEQTAVAEIVRGEKTYSFADLATAFAEAEDEDTIRLVSDEAVIDGETGRILIEKRVIFDLNGYTLTIGAGLGNTVALNVRANGDLTLTDSSEALTGKIDATEADKIVDHGTVPVGTMQAGAKLTVLSGTIIVDTDSESCVFGMAGTTISIEGGTFINLADTPYVHGGGTPLTVNIDKNASDASAILQVTGGTFIGRNPALGDDSVKTGNFIPDTVKLTLTYNEQGEAVYTVLDADAEVPEGTPAVYSVESGAVVATVYTAEGLEEALAEGYATVYLGADITANISVPAGRTLTLDLAGHTLTSNVENVATIYNEGDLTITSSSRGGAVTREATEADGTESTYYVIRNEGKMTLESSYLTVYNDNAADPSSVIGNNTGCRNSNPASLTIADGTYRSQASNAVKNDEYGILTITGGTFRTYSQNHAAVQNWATATISGGTFYGVRFALSVEVYNGQTNTTTIMGGTFRDADNAIFISDGYRDGSAVYEGGTIDLSVGGSAKIRGPITESEEFPISDGDDTLSVTVAPDDGFIVGSTEMLAQALNVNDTQIVLGAGLTYNFEVAAGKTFTLDLAGHTLTSDTANVATVTNYGDLTIIDSVGGGMITRGSSHYYVIVNEGTMTLDGITVENRSSSDVSSLIINNADLNSEDAAQLTILSGTYYSNRASNTVKNDEYGILYIRGGEFTSTSSNAQSAVLNWGYAEVSGDPVFQGNKIAFVAGAVKDQTGTTIISGGTFRTTNIAISGGAGALVLMVGDGSGSGAGMRNVTITGGNFEGTFKSIYYLNSSSSAITADTLTITGGHFTAPIEVRSEMKMSVTGGTFESTLSTGGQTEYISGGAFAREPAETAFAQDYAGVLYNGYYVVIETTTDDLGALIVARVNAQGDVRNYAASLDLIWADIETLAKDADSAFSSAAAAVIEAYDDIAYATSEGAVALARLSAMDALDTLLAQIRAEEEAAAEVLVAAKADAISQIDAAKAASEDQAAVVVPTATYLAINSAETVEEVAQYLENALAEIKDIRTYRAEIGGQTSALSDLAQQLEAITGEGGEFDSLLSEIKTAVSDAQKAIVGEGSSATLASVQQALEQKIKDVQDTLDQAIKDLTTSLSGLSSSLSELKGMFTNTEGGNKLDKILSDIDSAKNEIMNGNTNSIASAVEEINRATAALFSGLTADDGILTQIQTALDNYNTQLQSLTGALSKESGWVAEAIGGVQEDVTAIIGDLDSLATGSSVADLAAAVDEISGTLNDVVTTVDSIAQQVSASTAVEEEKENALQEIRVWLDEYLDEILGVSEARSAVQTMAYTPETTEGEIYAKLRQAFSEENAKLILKYYNDALASIDAATTVSDVTSAISTFQARVASVEAAAQNVPEATDLTVVYVLLAIVLAVAIAALVVVLLKKRQPAVAAAQPAEEQSEPVLPAPEAGQAEEKAEPVKEELAPAAVEEAEADDDKEQIVIAANVRSFGEAYVELSDDLRDLFRKVKEYALSKEGASEVSLSSGVCIKRGSKQIVKLTVRRGYPVALFLLENEMLKDFRRNASAQAKLKIRATELVLREEADLETAYTMVDLSIDQIEKDIENAKERRREARRARRQKLQAEAAAEKAASEQENGQEEN